MSSWPQKAYRRVISFHLSYYRPYGKLTLGQNCTKIMSGDKSDSVTMVLRIRTDIKHSTTGKNNRFPFLDIVGYLKNTHKNPKLGRVRQVPTRVLGWEFPCHVSLCQIWDFCGNSSNILKYPILGIFYFFLC